MTPKLTAYILNADGTVQPMPAPDGPHNPLAPTLFKGGATFTLAQLQAAVGGYIALIPTSMQTITKGSVDMVAVVNEDAGLNELPVNPVATLMFGSLGAPILGNVLLCPTWMVR